MCEENNETINHLQDECPVADSIWEKGASIFKKSHQHKGSPNITIAEWTMKVFKNKIVNRLWELLPSFTVWELWKNRNNQIFENKTWKKGEIWAIIEAHLKETITLHQWTWEDFIAEGNEIIICMN